MLYVLLLLKVSQGCLDHPAYPLHLSSRSLQTGPPVPEPDWRGVRITPHYLNNTGSLDDIKSKFIPLAIEWYRKVLKIVYNGDIYITSSICSGVEVPEAYRSTNTSTDVLVLITYDENGETGAWAQPCECSEDIGMRPILGRIHFQGSFDSMTWEQKQALCIHLLAHILAYDARLLPYFLGKIGETYGIDQVLGYTSRRDSQISYLKTPKLIEIAREAFQCNNLYGLDLENTFSEKSTSLHWEKRIMNNDFMVGDSNIYYISYSDISFSIFEDSGWYQVDYSYSNNILWGYHKGCEFLIDPCVEKSNYMFNEFCNTSSSISLCDHSHTFKGNCNLDTQKNPIPSQFQYFSNVFIGGNDSFADFCPYVTPEPAGSCRDIGVISTDINNKDYGESVCDNCKCLEGTYVSQFSTMSVHWHSGCHEITCEGNVAVVHVGGEVVFCDPGGGEVTVRGYDGYLICPSSDILCKDLPCPFACHGNGKCVSGQCDCDSGYSGLYCDSGSMMRGLEWVVFVVLLVN